MKKNAYIITGFRSAVGKAKKGGFRNYRPLVIRYDTATPITIGLFLLVAYSSWYLLKHGKPYLKAVVGLYMVYMLNIYHEVDFPKYIANSCEIPSLEAIAASKENPYHLDNNCNVVCWGLTTTPEDSELIVLLLSKWNICSEDIRFYQIPENKE